MTTTERNACPACGQNTEYESAADLLIIQIGDGIRFHDVKGAAKPCRPGGVKVCRLGGA